MKMKYGDSPTQIKVIGAGFGRTGTLSLKFALEKLGFGPCYHMKEIVWRLSHLKLWYNTSRGDPMNWNRLLKGFGSAVDYPVSLFYSELEKKYPKVKFILTIRDFDGWYESTKNTIYTVPTILPGWFMMIAYPIRIFIEMQNKLIWVNLFKNNFEDKEFARTVYYKHIEDVKKTVPRDKLMVYRVKDGWAPLCEFLEVDIPESIPFPKVNNTDEMLRNLAFVRSLPYLFILLMIVIAVLLIKPVI